ncbi:MAG: hypothetical protein OER77_00595 [Myxococcales bacterium]|nr:hypothetical protein [Myxococcales bacterium]
MFQLRWKPGIDNREPPSAMEWWERSFRVDDATEQITRLREQLGTAIARAANSPKPVFLRALGRDFDAELQRLAERTAFTVGESTSELRERCQLLEEIVDYYCDAVMPSTKALDAIELSDCAREAVAGLSADMLLVLRIQSEPTVVARRRQVISLLELAIRAAAAVPEDEVEVVLLPCSERYAEVRVVWPKSPTVLRDGHDKARFMALAVAYAIKVGGRLHRGTGARETLAIRIPRTGRPKHDATSLPSLDPDILAQATAFCVEV